MNKMSFRVGAGVGGQHETRCIWGDKMNTDTNPEE